jgi:hypothetical protein
VGFEDPGQWEESQAMVVLQESLRAASNSMKQIDAGLDATSQGNGHGASAFNP